MVKSVIWSYITYYKFFIYILIINSKLNIEIVYIDWLSTMADTEWYRKLSIKMSDSWIRETKCFVCGYAIEYYSMGYAKLNLYVHEVCIWTSVIVLYEHNPKIRLGRKKLVG